MFQLKLRAGALAGAEEPFELRGGFAAEESIQLLELSAFPFPPDPALLAFTPQALAMKEEEATRAMPPV